MLKDEVEKFSKGPEVSKVVLKEQEAFENKTDHHNNDRKSHFSHHTVICHYCGRSGHTSHTCNIRRKLYVRNKFVWIPKGQVRSSTNHVGPKYKWVPKPSSSALLVQEGRLARFKSPLAEAATLPEATSSSRELPGSSRT